MLRINAFTDEFSQWLKVSCWCIVIPTARIFSPAQMGLFPSGSRSWDEICHLPAALFKREVVSCDQSGSLKLRDLFQHATCININFHRPILGEIEQVAFVMGA